MTERSVIVVASEETATAWARRVREDGLPARALPWSVVERGPDVARAVAVLAPTAPRPEGGRLHVLLTSANGVRFLPDGIGRGHEAVVVGPGTAKAARAAGFTVPPGLEGEGSAGFAPAALRLVKTVGRTGTAIWLRGRPAVREGVDLLRGAGWTVDEVLTYVTSPRPAFEAEVRSAPPARAVVVGSPAAAEALVRALGADVFPPPIGGPRVFVPGETTARLLRVAGRSPPEIVPGLPVGLAAAIRAPAPPPDAPPWKGFASGAGDPE